MTEGIRYDPTGALVLGLRDYTPLRVALESAGGGASWEYRRVSGGEAKIPPPHVVVVPQGINPDAFGRTSRRLGLARHQYAFRCVAPATLSNGKPNEQGGAQAAAIAGAVAMYLASNGWTTRTVGGGTYAIGGAEENSTAGAAQDPDTRDPFVLVVGSIVASVQTLG